MSPPHQTPFSGDTKQTVRPPQSSDTKMCILSLSLALLPTAQSQELVSCIVWMCESRDSTNATGIVCVRWVEGASRCVFECIRGKRYWLKNDHISPDDCVFHLSGVFCAQVHVTVKEYSSEGLLALAKGETLLMLLSLKGRRNTLQQIVSSEMRIERFIYIYIYIRRTSVTKRTNQRVTQQECVFCVWYTNIKYCVFEYTSKGFPVRVPGKVIPVIYIYIFRIKVYLVFSNKTEPVAQRMNRKTP